MFDVLLLAPSRGLGGGIERYLATVEAGFAETGVRYRRIDLLNPGKAPSIRTRARFAARVLATVVRSQRPIWLVVGHVNLLPLVSLVSRCRAFTGATVLVYGAEIWSRKRLRGRRTISRHGLRVVTISNFSAGALVATSRASVLQPGITQDWYESLVAAAERPKSPRTGMTLITTFRLSSWRGKGLDTLFAAVEQLGDQRIHLKVCGRGPVPDDLAEQVSRRPWCTILADITDDHLADELARADLFVLATRTRTGRRHSGEGFGFVLLEAQLAGTPVVAPAYGGSGDTFQHGLTGIAPVDETPEALAQALSTMLCDDEQRTEMGRQAARLTRARYEPKAYARYTAEMVLGHTLAT